MRRREREKGWSLGGTCERAEIKANKGEMKAKVAVIIQINEKWSQAGGAAERHTLAHTHIHTHIYR